MTIEEYWTASNNLKFQIFPVIFIITEYTNPQIMELVININPLHLNIRRGIQWNEVQIFSSRIISRSSWHYYLGYHEVAVVARASSGSTTMVQLY